MQCRNARIATSRLLVISFAETKPRALFQVGTDPPRGRLAPKPLPGGGQPGCPVRPLLQERGRVDVTCSCRENSVIEPVSIGRRQLFRCRFGIEPSVSTFTQCATYMLRKTRTEGDDLILFTDIEFRIPNLIDIEKVAISRRRFSKTPCRVDLNRGLTSNTSVRDVSFGLGKSRALHSRQVLTDDGVGSNGTSSIGGLNRTGIAGGHNS